MTYWSIYWFSIGISPLSRSRRRLEPQSMPNRARVKTEVRWLRPDCSRFGGRVHCRKWSTRQTNRNAGAQIAGQSSGSELTLVESWWRGCWLRVWRWRACRWCTAYWCTAYRCRACRRRAFDHTRCSQKWISWALSSRQSTSSARLLNGSRSHRVGD